MKPVFNQVLLLACAVCLGAVLALQLVPKAAEAQRVGPFTLVAHSNNTANVGIFRVDQSSGSVSFCIVDNGNLATRCGPSS